MATSDLIRVSTAGSVDDGKSTLIGRLMYDCNALSDQKLQEIQAISARKGKQGLDFSLVTDGLVSEREQGITIDVAHIYFNADGKRFMVADTPGHEEYTRNMVTGASETDKALILVDVRKPLQTQTRRHLFIAAMLGLEQIIIVLNKMDLVDFDASIYEKREQEVRALCEQLQILNERVSVIPVSALHGDNVVIPSHRMSWFTGTTILAALLRQQSVSTSPARLQVQYVIQPDSSQGIESRYYCGTLRGSALQRGQEICVLPSGRKAKIDTLTVGGLPVVSAEAEMAVALTLSEQLDAGRGSMIVDAQALPCTETHVEALLCQVDAQPLHIGQTYLVQKGSQSVLARLENIERLDCESFTSYSPSPTLSMNELGRVRLQLQQSIFHDDFVGSRHNGSFILVDQTDGATLSAGTLSGNSSGMACDRLPLR